VVVTRSRRSCLNRRKINLGKPLVGQAVGVREVDSGIRHGNMADVGRGRHRPRCGGTRQTEPGLVFGAFLRALFSVVVARGAVYRMPAEVRQAVYQRSRSVETASARRGATNCTALGSVLSAPNGLSFSIP